MLICAFRAILSTFMKQRTYSNFDRLNRLLKNTVLYQGTTLVVP
jgi:hypothetical protein